MAITVMNGAQEIESIINPPVTPDLKRDAQGKFISPTAPEPVKEPVEAKVEPAEELPEWVTRLKITPDQHKEITEVIKRAIGKKHAQAKEAEEFAQDQYNHATLAERRAEELQRKLDELSAKAEPPKPKEEPKKPERSTFKSDEEWVEAVADWKAEQKFAQREAQQAQEREQIRLQSIKDTAISRVESARKAVDDYDEVVSAADIEVLPHIASYMQESELFAELGYHFAKNPDDLKRLNAMPTRTAVDLQRLGVAIAKIESKIEPFASKAKPSTGSKPDIDTDPDGTLPSDTGTLPSPKPRAAAPVIQPLNVGSGTQVEKRESEKSYEEARASWEKRNRRDFSRRSRH